MIRDRITRVRYERTQTMKEPRDPNAPKGFSSFQDDEELEGLSQDEKMKRIAAKMEERFKTEQKRKPSIQAVCSCLFITDIVMFQFISPSVPCSFPFIMLKIYFPILFHHSVLYVCASFT